MAEKKAKRGRPKGSGIDDSELLASIAAIMAADPEAKPTTAIKKAGITNPSTIRRLRDKFSQDERKLMKAAGGKPQRRKAAPAAAKAAPAPKAAPKAAAKAPATKAPKAKAPKAKAPKAAPVRKAAAKAAAPAPAAAKKPAAKAAPARKAAAPAATKPAAKKPAAKATKAAAKAPARAAAKAAPAAKKPTAGRAPGKRTVAKAAGKGAAKKSSSDHLVSRPLKSMPASSYHASSGKVSAAAGNPAGAAENKTAGAAQLLRFVSQPDLLMKQMGRLPKDVDAVVGSLVENQIQVYETAVKSSPLATFLRQQAFMIDMSLSILKAQRQWSKKRPGPTTE